MKSRYWLSVMLIGSVLGCSPIKGQYDQSGFLVSCAESSSSECANYIKGMMGEVLSCYSSLSVERLGTNYEDFVSGLIYGLQEDPRNPSQCMRSADPLNDATSTLQQRIEDLFDEFKVLSLFDILDDFNEFMNQLVSLYELCTIQTLIKRIVEVPTRDGLAYIVLRLGSYFDTIIDGIDFGTQELINGDFEQAGRNYGVAIQFLFDFAL